MDEILADLSALEATAEAELRRWSEEEQQAKEKQREAGESKRRAADQLRLIRRAMARYTALVGGSSEMASLPEAGAVVSPSGERPIGMGHEKPPWVLDRVFDRFLAPEKDAETGEPVYDVRVVSGEGNYRARALSAAQVYGPEIREIALARAIYHTGETNATDVTSARSSLGALVRYGDDWVRKDGWLVYRGGELEPDKEMITMLVNERQLNPPKSSDI